MILDLERFVREGEPRWQELEALLTRLERHATAQPEVVELERLHALYQRTSADLLRVRGLPTEGRLRGYLESLVSRGYTAIHGVTERQRGSWFAWFWRDFPQAVRRRPGELLLVLALFWGGAAAGAGLLVTRFSEREMLFPFDGLAVRPSQRVQQEMEDRGRQVGERTGRFSAQLIQNNTRVAFFTFALGMTYGVGPTVLLLANGAYVGAVAADYVLDGQTMFLLGWLLPHGVIELPAIFLAGQAAFVLTGALLPRGRRAPVEERLRDVFPDTLAILGGVAVMLGWAGVVEAFFSQYHEPVIPYAVKIAFGVGELGGLVAFLRWAGRDAG
ncbi:MAG: stage II sporulation protein M [Acidobacteriota bacterium]